MQNEIHQALLQNHGNRLTAELIHGLTVRMEMIAKEAIAKALKARDDAPKEHEAHA